MKHYIASRSPGNCTFEGIRRSFLETASKVDTNGILIFSFTGHGLKIGERKFGLAPVDFNYRSETFITADVLINWLHFSRFQGQYVLFIFDCCFAGGISEQMVLSSVEADLPIPGLFVFTSCTAFESSLVVTSLGHSIFNYFLSFSLFNSYDSQNGRLAIKNVFENCDLYCIAFSSLLVSYDSNLQLLKWNMMQPEFKYFQLTPYLQSLFEESDEEVDAGEPGRFAFALKYYNFAKKSIVIIPDKCQGWLEVVSGTDGPLATLVKADLLEGALLSAAIGSMMYSMASIFVACGQPDISNRNVFMVAFIHVIAAIDRVLQGVAVTGRDMKLSIEYYFSVLEKHKIKSGELKKLYNSVCADVRKYEGEESIDSGEGSNEVRSLLSTSLNLHD